MTERNRSRGGQQDNQLGQQTSTKGGQGGQRSNSKGSGGQVSEQQTSRKEDKQRNSQNDQGLRGGSKRSR